MPVIEEIDDEDIDNKHFSLEDFDSHNPFSRDMPVDAAGGARLRPTGAAGTSGARDTAKESPEPPMERHSASSLSSESIQLPRREGAELPEHMKHWKILYPVYFDRARTSKEGRRVPHNVAVDNPLVTTLADACRELNIEPALELTKRHPKDWANPGRVRVNLPAGQTKRELYARLCDYMRKHPASSRTARESMYKTITQFDSLNPLAVPRNMKISKVLPGVSPALSAQKIIDDSMKTDGNQMAKMMGM